MSDAAARLAAELRAAFLSGFRVGHHGGPPPERRVVVDPPGPYDGLFGRALADVRRDRRESGF